MDSLGNEGIGVQDVKFLKHQETIIVKLKTTMSILRHLSADSGND